MFGLIKQMFVLLLSFRRSLASIVNAPGHTKCTSNVMPANVMNTASINFYNKKVRSKI